MWSPQGVKAKEKKQTSKATSSHVGYAMVAGNKRNSSTQQQIQILWLP
jgi:hypothetical protein